MTEVTTLLVYCTAILVASFLGGWVPMRLNMTHSRLEVAVSFVAGIMLGVGVFHMLPHAVDALKSAERVSVWIVVGLLTMFFLERFFCYHHHTAPPASDDNHTGNHHHAPCSHRHEHGHKIGWAGAFVGFTIHTLVAGIALAASVRAGDGSGAMAGLGTFLVIVLHKPLDSLTISMLMGAEGWSVRARHIVNALFALLIPVGVGIFCIGADVLAGTEFVGCALAFSAGTFLCVSLSDLLPELQFHDHDRIQLSAALVVGLCVAYGIGQLEHRTHHTPATPSEHQHHDHHDHHHDHGAKPRARATSAQLANANNYRNRATTTVAPIPCMASRPPFAPPSATPVTRSAA